MPSYQLQYEPGDQIIIEGRYHVILDVDEQDNEYHMAWKGRFRWKDAQEIDAVASQRDARTSHEA